MDKAALPLDSLVSHLRDAEAALKYAPETPDAWNLEAEVLMLLSTVRKAFAGSLDIMIDRRYDKWERNAKIITLKSRLDDIERMLWEERYSPAFPKSAVSAWRQELLDFRRQGHRRMSYTCLFGDLTTEWVTVRFGELSAAKGVTN